MSGAEPRVFVDSNILIYAHDRSAARKRDLAASRIAHLWRAGTGVISVQVLQEFYVNVTRKVAQPITKSEALGLLELYARWEVITPDPGMVFSAVRVEERFQLSFWDALIVTCAQAAGATTLLSEDLQSGQSFDGVVVENPFL
jgi:predicted nucleic acid-binding protein